MTFFIALVTILQVVGVSLGVGSSTLAITNFFVAIADGKIDDTERRMMGVVYVVLRVAMVVILVTTVILISYEFGGAGVLNMPGFAWAEIIVLLVLYTNALLMTHHLMPSTFGPALQGGSWYTLGVLAALQILDYTGFTLGLFIMAYISWLILAVGIVNGIMAMMKAKKENKQV
ncbi:hypothetical protein KC851_02335 [Candidatus Kaiserbacteria bacterium]|nr:hypothetical protein [Candidatus Kaiserbacteria bacterium]